MAEPTNMAKINRKSEFCGWGAVVQIAGVGFCLTIIGAILGIPLLIIGGRMARVYRCSHCGNKVSEKTVKICPVCHSEFY